jgi:hypothetical protein
MDLFGYVAWLQGRCSEIQKSRGKREKKGKGAEKEQIRRLGRSGKRNDLYKGHTDILPKVENGKQLGKKGAFQGFDAVFKRKKQMYAKGNKMAEYSFLLN